MSCDSFVLLTEGAKRKCCSPVDLLAVIYPDVAYEINFRYTPKEEKKLCFTQQYNHT